MYEELIKALRFCAEKSNGWNCPACPGFDGLCSTGKEIRATAADAIRAQNAQLAAKDAEIEQVRQTFRDAVEGLTVSHDNLYDRLARVAAEKNDLRNELCQQCGKYRMAHKGACDRCRWRTPENRGRRGMR